MFVDCLSTSSKILLAAEYYDDVVINAVEIGHYAFDYIRLIDNGHVFIGETEFEFSTDIKKQVFFNNIEYDGFARINALLGGYAYEF